MLPERRFTSPHQPDLILASDLFTRTTKEASGQIRASSHQLLLRAGYIHQEASGLYSLLPLGMRTIQNIQEIVRQEMLSIGGQEILMPTLQPRNNWEATERWDSFDSLFKTRSRTGSEYALGPTHEEIVVPLVRHYIKSYRDLPIAVFQMHGKMRDEERAKSGILRGREFEMKDMYSFHASEQDLAGYYNMVRSAYFRIFQKCGLDVRATEASGGTFTAGQTEEFMLLSEIGEDLVTTCNNCHFTQNIEVSTASEGETCPSCNDHPITNVNAIELGHIFNLGDKFTRAFDLRFVDKSGELRYPVMGCYGIGLTRLMGAIVEINHDERGIIWPDGVSPFDAHVIILNSDNEETREYGDKVVTKLRSLGLGIYLDDRLGVSAGEKFVDADLIGISTQVIVSNRMCKQNKIEIKTRSTGERIIREI